MCIASDEMTTISDEYRVKAAECRAKAERERDRLFRSMFERLSKTYSRLADLADEADRKAGTELAYRKSPPIAGDDPESKQQRET